MNESKLGKHARAVLDSWTRKQGVTIRIWSHMNDCWMVLHRIGRRIYLLHVFRCTDANVWTCEEASKIILDDDFIGKMILEEDE